MKTTVPARFVLKIATVKLDNQSAAEFRACVRRKGKTVNSKAYRRTGQYTPINQTLEFPTTLEQTGQTCESKKITLELQVRDVNESTMQSMSVELELTFFLESKQFDVLVCNEKMTASIKIEGSIHTQKITPSNSILQACKSSDIISEKENAYRQQSKSSFGVTKKTKTWLNKNQDDSKCTETTNLKINSKPKSLYIIEQPVEVKVHQGTKAWDNLSANNDPQHKKRVLFQQSKTEINNDNGLLNNAVDFRSTKSQKEYNEQSLRNELFQLRKSNKLLVKEMQEMKFRLNATESKENSNASLEKSVITRLKDEVADKNKTIRSLEQKIEELLIKNRGFEDETTKYQRQISDMLSMTDKTSSLHAAYKGGDDQKEEMQKMQKQYEAEILQLKRRCGDVKRQLLFKDLQNASIPANMINTQICLSKQCDTERKELKNSVKTLKKSLEETQSKLKTKEKLLETYNSLKVDRQRQCQGGKDNDRWKVEKSFMEQQIAQLKQQLSSLPGINTQVKDVKVLRGLYVRRSQKQALQKQLQKFKKVVYQNGQQHNTEQKQLKDQLIKIKLLTMNILNAVQEQGGRILYDKVCEAFSIY